MVLISEILKTIIQEGLHMFKNHAIQIIAPLLLGSVLVKEVSAAIYRPEGDVANLISAIGSANASSEDDTIDLEGFIYELTAVDNSGNGDNGLPILTSGGGKLRIINGGIRRSRFGGTPSFRFFYIGVGANLALFNVTLENGVTDGGALNDDSPGGLDVNTDGGAIYNLGTLSLENCLLAGNQAEDNGGAIYNEGLINNVDNCMIVQNLSSSSSGGAIYNAGTITGINRSTFSYNEAPLGDGGAIFNVAGSIGRIYNSAFDNNSSGSEGGGIYNGSTITTMSNCTMYLNDTTDDGGAINNAGTMSIINSTISTNLVGEGSTGAGIYNSGTINSLISNIVALNSADSQPDIDDAGTITSESHNLISDTDGNSLIDGVNYDIVTSNPVLIGLSDYQDNGGSTPTMALLPSSLAINNGLNPGDFHFDQRGPSYYRTVCALTDIGAFENQWCRGNPTDLDEEDGLGETDPEGN